MLVATYVSLPRLTPNRAAAAKVPQEFPRKRTLYAVPNVLPGISNNSQTVFLNF